MTLQKKGKWQILIYFLRPCFLDNNANAAGSMVQHPNFSSRDYQLNHPVKDKHRLPFPATLHFLIQETMCKEGTKKFIPYWTQLYLIFAPSQFSRWISVSDKRHQGQEFLLIISESAWVVVKAFWAFQNLNYDCARRIKWPFLWSNRRRKILRKVTIKRRRTTRLRWWT